MHATFLKKASGIIVALAAMGRLSACGQSRYQPVIAEDVFAPAYKVDDRATAEVQTLFTDQPETSKATYSRTSQTTNGGTASAAGHGRQSGACATDGAGSGSCAVFHEFGSAARADRRFSALDRQLKQHRQRAFCASRTG